MRANRFALLFLFVLACGDDDDKPSDTPDANVMADASAPKDAMLSMDASPRDAAVDANVKQTCTGTQIRCRGACLQNASDKANGCEMVMGAKDDLQSIDIDKGELYALSYDGLRARRLMRLTATTSTDAIKLPDLTEPDDVQVVDGFVYFNDGDNISRIGVMETQAKPVVARRKASFTQVVISEGYLYQFGRDATNLPLQRTPVTGGTTENIGTYVNLVSLAIDANNYYLYRGFPDGVFTRMSRANPTQTADANADGSLSGAILLWPQDLTHVYFFDGSTYLRIDKTTLKVEKVAETDIRGSSGKQVGDHYIIQESYSSGGKDVSRIVGLRWDGRVDVIDNEAGGDVTEDAHYYYLVRGGAFFRIAR